MWQMESTQHDARHRKAASTGSLVSSVFPLHSLSQILVARFDVMYSKPHFQPPTLFSLDFWKQLIKCQLAYQMPSPNLKKFQVLSRLLFSLG